MAPHLCYCMVFTRIQYTMSTQSSIPHGRQQIRTQFILWSFSQRWTVPCSLASWLFDVLFRCSRSVLVLVVITRWVLLNTESFQSSLFFGLNTFFFPNLFFHLLFILLFGTDVKNSVSVHSKETSITSSVMKSWWNRTIVLLVGNYNASGISSEGSERLEGARD